MAILKEGINGPFSGKVGSIVGYQLNGQTIIRGLPSNVKGKPTELALINRGKMKAVSKFLTPLKPVIKFGYKYLAPAGSRVGPFQTAQSYHFKNAIDFDENTVPYVNPEKALMFRGDLTPLQNVEVKRENDILEFNWDKDINRNCEGNLVIVAYPVGGFCDFSNGDAKVSDSTFRWKLDQTAGKENLHIYVGVYNIFQDKLSDSVYCGCF